ncbi:MAG: phytanoyl-CoA dioxygenase family protein [Lentisphaerae bacterium]|nr:phytanoyl-CoA dioxygenase family protein [Lentisphaerota bacterium]
MAALNGLTPEQVRAYREEGYLIGLPAVFDAAETRKLNADLGELMHLLEPGEGAKEIREWHEASRWLYDVCMHPQILNYVEDLIGPDFYLWASNFFIKEPQSRDIVGWHQDAYYWPLAPHNTVTVWLAFLDSDRTNAAMQVIPRSHLAGLMQHKRSTQTDSVLTLELERGQFREDVAVPLELKAGHMSLHDDRIVHGSGANHSDRRRVGLTMRYSGTNVKCDLSVNPHFRIYMCRGADRFHHNPHGMLPTARFGRLNRQHLSVEEAGPEAERKLGF